MMALSYASANFKIHDVEKNMKEWIVVHFDLRFIFVNVYLMNFENIL